MTTQKERRLKLIPAFCLLVCLLTSLTTISKAADPYYYQIKVYHFKDQQQQERVNKYLASAFVPSLHRFGIKQVGVFKPVQDTAEQKIYVFIPVKSVDQLEKLNQFLTTDKQYQEAGKDYIDASYKDAPYVRIESILLKAFPGMPAPSVPALTAPKNERVYELRSYEGPTEKYFKNKVQMFNKGDEIGLFKKLGFNAVFYSEVISGSRMPNLMYMTTFNNKADRDKHWDAFNKDEYWKKLSSMPEYQNNVSKADIIFLNPTNYSDF